MHYFRSAKVDAAAAAAAQKGGSVEEEEEDLVAALDHATGTAVEAAGAGPEGTAEGSANAAEEKAAADDDDDAAEEGEASDRPGLAEVPLDSSPAKGDDEKPELELEAAPDPPEEREEEESHGSEYTDDSEYTYETDEEDDEGRKRKTKGGWFGFLRRSKADEEEDSPEDESMEERSESEPEEEGDEEMEAEDESEEASEGEDEEVVEEEEEEEEDHESSSDSEHGTHHLLNSNTPPREPLTSPTTTAAKEQEEAALMAEAIQRVQQRIHSKGGNLYDALSEEDQQLVDSLKGVQDEGTIREAVARSIEQQEKEEAGLHDEPAVEAEPSLHADEPMLHGEPTVDPEVSVREDERPTFHDEPSADVEPSLHADEPVLHEEPVPDAEPVGRNGHSNVEAASADARNDGHHEMDEDDDNDDGDEDGEEQPTIEEQRSLLSLAAEHDRVDVIQELLRDLSEDPDLFASLLEGISLDDAGGDVSFVPPPLHAAVAHGSANAASCLLRMGADPSLRPVVPSAYLSPSYSPYRRSGSGVEEDRNYKKYHGMSAWELAFGSTVAIEGETAEGAAAEEAEEEVTATSGGGWFGFGSPKKEPEAPPAATAAAAATRPPRTKRKSPLNIAPAKLDGIHHAFTAEALRAIGSDEVDRLAQLLDAGMEATAEAAGKTLAGWARELDARACGALLGSVGDDAVDDEAPGKGPAEGEGGTEAKADGAPEHSQGSEGATPAEEPPTAMQDERLAGMSLADVQTLVRESQNLLPQLTACRDDLAAEAAFNRSILEDIVAMGGKGGLSSQSLLEVVRGLKDRRAEAEEAADAWQKAWEEREDELDFFWEEVLNDELRGELGGALDRVSVDPDMPGAGDASDDMEGWTKRYIEVDNHVNSLRTSIANLAEESSRCMAEIESHGMGGALSLTRSIREEIKEMEKTMSTAQAGEALCRRKIEIIQQRLGHNPTAEENEGVQQGEHTGETDPAMRDDGELEDYQLRAIVQQPQHQPEKGEERYSPTPPAVEPEHHAEVVNDEHQDESPETVDEVYSGESTVEEGESSYDEESYDESHDGSDGSIGESVDETNDEAKADSTAQEEVEGRFDDVQEPKVSEPSTGSGDDPNRKQNVAPLDANAEETFSNSEETPGQESITAEGQTSSKAVAPDSGDLKPSKAITEGMSTAIVVHSPNSQASSLSSQLWEILKRIVGLGRVPSRQDSYHDAPENNPHIMIV